MGESILRDRVIPLQVGDSSLRLSKGNRVNIPEPGRGHCAATQVISVTPAGAPGRVLFSF